MHHDVSLRTAQNARRSPVWSGPCGDGDNGGITFSLLSRWLCCRERFRLLVVEGLKSTDHFNYRIHYGLMWHVCEESYAAGRVWELRLGVYVEELNQQYPLSREHIRHWANVCSIQFPLYVEHWSKHADVKNHTPLMQETVFDVPYKLPSGRVVRLRGKWDSVYLHKDGADKGVWLMENKTKGDIDAVQMQRQLTFDLQVMTYLVALMISHPDSLPGNLRGVLYNVIRRPLSGGKGSIVRHKPTKNNPLGESEESYYARLAEYIKDDPEHYFMRWKVEVTSGDIETFRRTCLDPILEQLCDWWEWIKPMQEMTNDPFRPDPAGSHWRTPYGVWNSLLEGGSTEIDGYLSSKSEMGLSRTTNLFLELQ